MTGWTTVHPQHGPALTGAGRFAICPQTTHRATANGWIKGERRGETPAEAPMTVEVGSIIAQAHARHLECLACGYTCEPDIIARRTIGGDHYETLRCKEGEGQFRRIWVGGYR